MSQKIVAITACPTGIAHTYMAAEKLEQTAKLKGIEIKVETRGSTGAKNVLTKGDIEEAIAVIIASDIKIDLERFDGKHLIQVPVIDGIHKADELIDKALRQDAPIYKTNTNHSHHDKRMYKHLMSGISHMIPFVVAGGLLISIAYLIDYQNNGTVYYGIGNPISKFLYDLGNMAFSFMLPILAGYIAYSIADRPGLIAGFVGGALASKPIGFDSIGESPSGFLGALVAGFIAGYLMLALKNVFKRVPQSLEGIKPILLYPLFGILITSILMVFINLLIAPINTGLIRFLNQLSGVKAIILGILLGGMMAIDLGGPINKAAYSFGIASLLATSGTVSSAVMAAVMAGGMTPPLATAFATTLFPRRFTKQERDLGKSNYVMGISFVTEGAIPFAASKPSVVIPSLVAGSSLAGALSMMFNVRTPAPHGGLFILPVIHHWYFYLVALLAGVLLSAVLLGVFLPKFKTENMSL